MVLASGDGHKVNKNLKAHLVQSELPDLDKVGRSNHVEGKISLSFM